MRKLVGSSLIVIAVWVWGTAADATQITLGNSDSGSVYTFTGTGGSGSPPNAIKVSTSGLSGTSEAFFPGDNGTYTFGTTNFTTNSVVLNNFAIVGPNNTESFDYLAADGDHLAGTITWTQLKDNSPAPDLIGTLTYTASGDAAFLAVFGPSCYAYWSFKRNASG